MTREEKLIEMFTHLIKESLAKARELDLPSEEAGLGFCALSGLIDAAGFLGHKLEVPDEELVEGLRLSLRTAKAKPIVFVAEESGRRL